MAYPGLCCLWWAYFLKIFSGFFSPDFFLNQNKISRLSGDSNSAKALRRWKRLRAFSYAGRAFSSFSTENRFAGFSIEEDETSFQIVRPFHKKALKPQWFQGFSHAPKKFSLIFPLCPFSLLRLPNPVDVSLHPFRAVVFHPLGSMAVNSLKQRIAPSLCGAPVGSSPQIYKQQPIP